jgi:prepilin signal peptidase PulO-like enzyme (type II secretory pathway)
VRLVRGQELLGYGAMKTLAAMGAWLGPVASLVVFVGALTLKHAGLVLYDKAAIFETTICPIGPQIALCAMFYLLWGRRCRSVDERMVVFRRASC